MYMETGRHRRSSDAHSLDASLERLRRDLLDTPPVGAEPDEAEGPELIDYASLEFEVQRMRQRLAIWEIFMTYMRDGARTWPEVQQAMTQEDFDKIVTICDGVPLRDLMLDMR
jgi:hypothetical protein